MAPPTPLAIATQAVNRLVKEHASYYKEQAGQEKRVQKLENDIAANSPDLDSNADYILKQEASYRHHPPLPNMNKDDEPTLTLGS